MKQSTKRIFIVGMVLVLLFLTACGANTANESSKTDSQTAENSQTQSETVSSEVVLTEPEPTLEYDKLTDAQIDQMEYDYHQHYHFNDNGEEFVKLEDVNFRRPDHRYFGTYTDGAIAFYMGGWGPTAILEYEIAGCEFYFPTLIDMAIYHDSTFTPLKEFYEKGVLTDDDVKQIHKLYQYNDCIRVLNEETINDWRRYYIKDVDEDKDIDIYDVSVDNVCWLKGLKCYAMFIYLKDEFSPKMTEEKIGNVNFVYFTENPLKIYYNDEIVTVKQLYADGVLTDEDVEDIYNSYILWLMNKNIIYSD